MPGMEIELDPADFVTVGTIGPKGRREFHLQAAQQDRLVTLIIEKEQARALAEAIGELMDGLAERYPDRIVSEVNLARWDLALREPIEPLFRVAEMGLGYDEDRDLIILIARELVTADEELLGEATSPTTVRIWATQSQARALSQHARHVVEKGRANPKKNGHVIYYWL